VHPPGHSVPSAATCPRSHIALCIARAYSPEEGGIQCFSTWARLLCTHCTRLSDCARCHTRNEESGVNCDGRFSCYRQRYWLAQTLLFAVLVPLVLGTKLPIQWPVVKGVSVRWQRSWHGWTTELPSTASIGRHSRSSSSLTLSKGRRAQPT